MHRLSALTIANALDQLRRGSTLALASVGALLILSLRYFNAFGLGYEVVQLKEMATYTIGLLLMLGTFLFSLPRDDDSAQGADIQLLARPVSPLTVSLGCWLGRLACLALLALCWIVAIFGALWWFKLSEPRLFEYRGATSAFEEGLAVIGPVFGQFLASAIILAFVQSFSRTRRPLLIAAGMLGLYVVGFGSAALGEPWVRILPEFSRYDLTPSLWGGAAAAGWPWLLLHATAWCAVGLALDSSVLRSRMAS